MCITMMLSKEFLVPRHCILILLHYMLLLLKPDKSLHGRIQKIFPSGGGGGFRGISMFAGGEGGDPLHIFLVILLCEKKFKFSL